MHPETGTSAAHPGPIGPAALRAGTKGDLHIFNAPKATFSGNRRARCSFAQSRATTGVHDSKSGSFARQISRPDARYGPSPAAGTNPLRTRRNCPAKKSKSTPGTASSRQEITANTAGGRTCPTHSCEPKFDARPLQRCETVQLM